MNRKQIILIITLLFVSLNGLTQTQKVNENIDITKLSDRVYLYTSWADVGKWGRVGSNGLIIISKGKAFLVDTPMHESQTIELNNWINNELNTKITGFIPGHWHDDCIGGLDYLNKQGVKTYANKLTNEILESKGLPQAKNSFTDSITLHLDKILIKCYFLGGGHATDNIVVWIPSEKILFGGCMIKDCASTTLGNTADAAPLEEWLKTVTKIETKFPDAKIIIPGHGEIGGQEILKYNQRLLNKFIKER